MNLVQIQERLKDAPVQAIMQYANGGNPMVPPYLALAELKRRESISQSAQSQQAMQQGQPPSVKEQIEKAAGLAALQQQMQQQGLQGLMAQARPQGIPENVPQPRRQPESEGVAGLPAGDFNFADGGIVAFSKGGPSVSGQKESGFSTGEEELIPLEQMRAEYMRLLRNQQFGSARQLAERIKARQEVESKTVTMPAAQLGEDVKPAPQRAPAAPQMAEQTMAQPMGAPPAERRAGALPSPGGMAGLIALPSRGLGAIPPGAPDDTAMPAVPSAPARGIAALPGADEAMQMMLGQMRAKPDLAQAAEDYRKAQGLFGIAQPYGEERMKRAQAMEAARQQELESRGVERLMRVMGGIGARGLAGASPAYLQSIEAERAADAAFRKQMDELMGGVEAQRRAEAMTGMTETQKRVQKERELGLGVAEKVYDAQRKREDEAFRIRLEHQLRMMQPNEASILLNVMADLRKRNPDKSEAEIYAMAREAQQGATPELKRQQDYAKQYDIAAKNWADPTVLKEKGLTREQYIERHIREALQLPKRELDIGAVPPIPAGAVRLKGAQ